MRLFFRRCFDLDRKPEAFAALLEDYRRAAGA
jgi:hypothetical protein